MIYLRRRPKLVLTASCMQAAFRQKELIGHTNLLMPGDRGVICPAGDLTGSLVSVIVLGWSLYGLWKSQHCHVEIALINAQSFGDHASGDGTTKITSNNSVIYVALARLVWSETSDFWVRLNLSKISTTKVATLSCWTNSTVSLLAYCELIYTLEEEKGNPVGGSHDRTATDTQPNSFCDTKNFLSKQCFSEVFMEFF